MNTRGLVENNKLTGTHVMRMVSLIPGEIFMQILMSTVWHFKLCQNVNVGM